jgi:transposase
MRSPKKKPFSNSRKRSKFKITNWREYNNIVRNRGRVDFIISKNLGKNWYEHNTSGKPRGGQRIYSDQAILVCLQMRCLFKLKLRQCQGFINWLFEISGIQITCPDYTTLSRRGKSLDLEFFLGDSDREVKYVSIDSTGIQTYTGNEWLENKHGLQYIRRIWKKMHIVVDENGKIVANCTTDHKKDDRSQVKDLLKNVKTKELLGDPGYDGENIYKMLRAKGIKPTIRPPNNLVAKKAITERQHSATYQQTKGYHAWRNKNKYGRRELVENTFFRFKNSFGSKFLSRNDENMKNEMTIKCQLLNKMFEIGKANSMRVS